MTAMCFTTAAIKLMQPPLLPPPKKRIHSSFYFELLKSCHFFNTLFAGRGSCGCTCECDTTQYGWTWQGPACDCPTDPSDCYDTTMQVRVQLPLSRLIAYLVITNKLQMWFLSFLWPNIDWATLQWTGNMCLQQFWLWNMCV